MECRFRVLGVGLDLRGPREVVEPIRFAYRRFVETGEAPAGPHGIQLGAGPDAMLTVDGRPRPLVADLDRTLQVHQHFFNLLVDSIDSHAMIHAAALARSDGALLLAGPAGHGKTSLSLELAARGLDFMSDDFAPLDLQTGWVLPYPRAVALRPDGAAPIPPAFAAALTGPSAGRLVDKVLLDVGQVLGEDRMVREPLPLRYVVVLAGQGGPTPTRMEIGCLGPAAEVIERRLAAIRGVEIESRRELTDLRVWRLRLARDRQPTPGLSELLDDDSIVIHQKYWDARPDFTATPEAVPVGRRQAAAFLCQELLNRRGRGRLLRRYGGSLPDLYLDLAGALREARCWKITVGRYRETADLIERLVET